MRRWLTLGMGACLALGLAASSAWADSDVYQNARDSAKKSKWSWWPFGKKKEEPAKKTASRKAKDDDAKDELPAKPAPRPVVQQQSTQDPTFATREQAKVLRRQQVCDRLREMAQELNDPQLDAQVQLLEQRAWFIYEQRTARPGMAGLIPADESAAAGRLLRDTEPRLPSASAAASLDRPIRSVTANGNGTAKDRRED
ncbi:MAG: hypothetical protein L0099_10655 [Acidobacteria bacterium]|nr:hypothetical protein [Acidobacteriota bacterium]